MKYCSNCALRVQDTKCALTGRTIDPTTDYCSSHTTIAQTCEICGGITIPIASVMEIDENNNSHILCQRCNQAFETCASCDNAQYCDFETNPSTEPKTIIKQIRQGNSIMQIEIKNPSRIEMTCKQNCSCFDPENGCLREFNSQCGKYKHTWEE